MPADDRGAVCDAVDGGPLGTPSWVSVHEPFDQLGDVEPAPSRGVRPAQVAASVVEVQTINICPDAHRGSV